MKKLEGTQEGKKVILLENWKMERRKIFKLKKKSKIKMTRKIKR